MLSGIGPAEQLRELGIDGRGRRARGRREPPGPPVQHRRLRGRGRLARRRRAPALPRGVAAAPQRAADLDGRRGVRVRAQRPGLPAPDVQFHFAPAYFVDHGAEEFDGHALTLGPVLITPQPRAADAALRRPGRQAADLTNSLAEPEDVAALLAGMRIAREIVATEPLRSVVKRELFPGRPAPTSRTTCAGASSCSTTRSGTCRMGTDDGSVVDEQLRVRGVEGLRVADASIMPLIPGGNTNAPCDHGRRARGRPRQGPRGRVSRIDHPVTPGEELRAAMARVFAIYDAGLAEIQADIRERLASHPEFGPLIRDTPVDPSRRPPTTAAARGDGRLALGRLLGQHARAGGRLRDRGDPARLLGRAREPVPPRPARARVRRPASRAPARGHPGARPLARRRDRRLRAGVRVRQRGRDRGPAAGDPAALDAGAAAAPGPADPADRRRARPRPPRADARAAAAGRPRAAGARRSCSTSPACPRSTRWRPTS